MSYDYDLFVIGGGSAGVRAARRVSQLGKRVAIAEHSRLGGTCVIRGCVPKKLYFYAADFAQSFIEAESFGWNISPPTFDWSRLVSNKESEIKRLESLYRSGLESSGADIFLQRAILESPHEVRLTETDRLISAERIVLSVGGTPNRMTHLSGHEHCIISDDVFDLPILPSRIIINGGGYIAVEFAGIFNALGVETTLLYRGDRLLRGFDDDLRLSLTESYERSGIRVLTNTEISSVESVSGAKRVHLSTGETLESDEVLLATGRLPLSQDLGLDGVGVDCDSHGYIKVDSHSRTNVESIWALGDITNRVQLTPVAIHEAMCFVSTEYLHTPVAPDHSIIATAVYSHPEIGTVGLSEQSALLSFPDIDIYLTRFRPMRSTLSSSSHSEVLMKLVVDTPTDKVLGCHIFGIGADELIQALAISIKMGATKSNFDSTMAVHPTSAEELTTMYDSTYSFRGGMRV